MDKDSFEQRISTIEDRISALEGIVFPKLPTQDEEENVDAKKVGI